MSQSAVAAVAHFGVTALDVLGNLVKPCVLILTELHQEVVFLLTPGPFGSIVTLSQQILP